MYSMNASLNPPLPVSLISDSTDDGQRLMNIARSVDKEHENSSKDLEESIGILRRLIGAYSRRGFLEGDYEKAEKVLNKSAGGNTVATPASGSGGNSRPGKRGRQKAGGGAKLGSGGYFEGATEQAAGGAVNESLILTAVTRILGGHSTKELKSFNSSSESRMVQVELAADLCTSICEHIKAVSALVLDTCAVAEFELMASSGKSILSGLIKTVYRMLIDVSQISTVENDDDIYVSLFTVALDDKVGFITAIYSCLRAAASLVSMFGAKLSRSASLMLEIQSVGWTALALRNHEIQSAAAALIATLPFVGDNSDKLTPSDLWTAAIMDSAIALSTMLTAISPMSKKLLTVVKNNSRSVSEHVSGYVSTWIAILHHKIRDQQTRAEICTFLISGLANVLRSLLSRDCLYHEQPEGVLLCAQLNVDRILDVIETMLSLGVASEALYFSTRKRLRRETVPNGLLSPSLLALVASNHIKLVGHESFVSILNAVHESVLLPYARRIMRITYVAILTSSSTALRKVLDPGSASELDGKKRRWLHTSIHARSVALRTFAVVVQMFGSDPSTSTSSQRSSSVSSQSSNDTEKSVELVVGTLLEQLTWTGQQRQGNDDWGSTLERVELAVAAVESLDAVLISCGGFISFNTRSLVDSIALAGLSSLVDSTGGVNNLASYTPLKIALLRLGCSCVITPWPDGASSSISEDIKNVATKCKNDGDICVRREAAFASRLTESIETPRVPALRFVTRRRTSSGKAAGQTNCTDGHAKSLSIEELAGELQTAQDEIARSEECKVERAASDDFRSGKRMKANHHTIDEGGIEVMSKAIDSSSSTNKVLGKAIDSSAEACSKETDDDDAKELMARTDAFISRAGALIADDAKYNFDKKSPDKITDNNDKKETKVEKLAVEQPNQRIQEKEHPVSTNDDSDEELPEIVDCGPDADDME